MGAPRNRAHDFFDTHVAPAVADWHANPTDMRRAMAAAVAINQMADHYWHGFSPVDPARVFHKTDPKAFRAELANRHPDWSLVRDVAEAHKHVKLNRVNAAVTSAGQSTVVTTAFGQRGFGTGPYGGALSVVISLNDGREIHLTTAVKEAMTMWSTLLV